MKPLPDMLRRLPYVFYTLAALFFVWELANQWMSISYTTQYASGTDVMVRLSKSMALFSAFREAVYILGNGAVLHVAIAIYDKVKGE